MTENIKDKIEALGWFKELEELTAPDLFQRICNADHDINALWLHTLGPLVQQGKLDQTTNGWKRNRLTLEYLSELEQELLDNENDKKEKELKRRKLEHELKMFDTGIEQEIKSLTHENLKNTVPKSKWDNKTKVWVFLFGLVTFIILLFKTCCQ